MEDEEIGDKFDKSLIKILEKEVMKEKWKKKARVKGEVINKRKSQKGSYIIHVRTRKSSYDVVVPIYKKREFEAAAEIENGDLISVVGDKQISGMVFCSMLEILDKKDAKQTKLAK